MITLLTIALLAPTLTPLDWQPTPTGVPDGVLYAVDTSADATWAVGTTLVGPYADFRVLAMRHDGTRWVPTPQPKPEGRLLSVAVRAPNDVWAVGELTGTGLVQRWNGRAWRALSDPLPEGASLTSVATLGRKTWIAGWAYSDQAGFRALVYRYDRTGRRSLAERPDLGFINDVLPVADNQVWTAGFGVVARHDGRRWTKTDLPGDDSKIVVMSLAAKGPNDIWAAGLREDPVLWRRPLVMHYDGTRWTEVPTPADRAQLNAIELTADGPVAVGESGPSSYALRWTNGAFQPAATPPGGSSLYGLAGGNGRLWVAGVAENTDPSKSTPYAAVADQATVISSRNR